LKNPRRLAEARRVLDLATSAQLRGDYATASRHHLRLLQLGEPGAAAFYHGFIRYRIHRDYEAGEKLFRHAIACGVDTHTAWHNLACCLRDQGRLPEAQALYLRAIERNPAAVESLNGYANTAYELGEVEAAQKAWERAFTLAPTINDPAQQYDLAIQYLTFGEYGVGWHLHRARWAAPLFTTNHLRPQGPEWDGKPVRTLLAIAEQGHGDAIMTMRWVPFMLERAERVHLAVHAGLVALVKRSFPDALVQRLEDPPPPYDAHVSLFDMPAIAGIEKPEDVPGQPYLDAEPAGVAPGRFRAGLVWAGGRDTHHDWRRSIPFSTIAPLLDTKGIGWHVLQLDRLEEFDAAQRKELVWHRDIGPLPNWYATARALKSLNLLITVDTGIAHLAGALGVPTWLLLPRLADYRWGLSGSATPWYPAMRLFRATKALDWRDVITDVQAALAEWTLAREAA
jgi:hypothetical protein